MRRLRAVSHTAPGRLRTLPLRHYGRCARSSLIKGSAIALFAVADYREAQPEAEKCRDGAPKGERARKREVRGNADRSWRAPHWPRNRMLSSDVPVRRLTTRLSALRLPFFIWRQSFRAVAWPKLGRKKRAARTGMLCTCSPHPEVLGAKRRASKGEAPAPWPASFEARAAREHLRMR